MILISIIKVKHFQPDIAKILAIGKDGARILETLRSSPGGEMINDKDRIKLQQILRDYIMLHCAT